MGGVNLSRNLGRISRIDLLYMGTEKGPGGDHIYKIHGVWCNRSNTTTERGQREWVGTCGLFTKVLSSPNKQQN